MLTLNKTCTVKHVKILVNQNGSKPQRVKGDNGRYYLISHATLIVPGVLDGSKGPLLYPADEIAKNVQEWDGRPIVLYHPMIQNPQGSDTGEMIPVSARRPDIFLKRTVGFNFNTITNEEDGSLESDLWFDEADLKRIHNDTYKRVVNGEVVELSTGLRTDDEIVPNGASYNGKNYYAIARNYRPDHIAILPDEVGACSINDGCGVNNEGKDKGKGRTKTKNNSKDKDCNKCNSDCECEKCKSNRPNSLNKRGVSMKTKTLTLNKNGRRGKLISMLTPKGCEKGLKTKLNKKSDDGILSHALMLLINAEEGEEEVAGVDIKGLADFLGIDVDPASDPSGFINSVKEKLMMVMDRLGGMPESSVVEPEVNKTDDVDDNEERDQDETEKPRSVATTGNKGKSKSALEEWESSMPDEAKAIWNCYKDIVNTERNRLIELIINNSKGTDEQKKAYLKLLKSKDVGELRVLVEMIPTTNKSSPNGVDDDDDDPPINNNSNGLDGAFNFLGMGFPGAGNTRGNKNKIQMDNEPLPLPRMDFSKPKS